MRVLKIVRAHAGSFWEEPVKSAGRHARYALAVSSHATRGSVERDGHPEQDSSGASAEDKPKRKPMRR
jgi:hypothetical protein